MVVSSGDINSALRLVCNGFLCGGGVLNRGFNKVVTAIDELCADCVTARRNKMQDRLHSLGNPRRCAGIRDIH